MTGDETTTTTEPDAAEAEAPAGPFTYHVAMRRALDVHSAAVLAAPHTWRGAAADDETP